MGLFSTLDTSGPETQRVPKILANPDGPAVPQLETEIDRLVYELYGLAEEEEEILVVDAGRKD